MRMGCVKDELRKSTGLMWSVGRLLNSGEGGDLALSEKCRGLGIGMQEVGDCKKGIAVSVSLRQQPSVSWLYTILVMILP